MTSIQTLFTWIGEKDSKELEEASTQLYAHSSKTISSIIASDKYHFDNLVFLVDIKSDESKEEKEEQIENLKKHFRSSARNKNLIVDHYPCDLDDPVDLLKIKDHALSSLSKKRVPNDKLFFNVGSGTWAMRWIWFLFSQTSYVSATVIRSSEAKGVEEVTIPYELSGSAIFQKQIISATKNTESMIFEPELEKSLKSPRMKRLINKSYKLAPTNQPIFILAKRGCPTEKLVQSIHNLSIRKKKYPSVSVIDGFDKMSKNEFKNRIRSAEYGSLLIENADALSPAKQQILIKGFKNDNINPEVFPRLFFSSTKGYKKIKKSKNINPNFLDIFMKITIKFPSLKDRGDDLNTIIQHRFKKICTDYQKQIDLSEDGLAALCKYDWPGNDVELDNALNQLALFANNGKLGIYEVTDTLFDLPEIEEIKSRDIENNFNLKNLLDDITSTYIIRAMASTGGNKTEAARLLGISSQQTLGKWMQRLKLGS